VTKLFKKQTLGFIDLELAVSSVRCEWNQTRWRQLAIEQNILQLQYAHIRWADICWFFALMSGVSDMQIFTNLLWIWLNTRRECTV